MSDTALLAFKALTGGLFVAGFAVVAELLVPKRFAGLFSASPAVALGNLLVIDHPSPGPAHPRHLGDRPGRVRDVVQRAAAHDEVEGPIDERQTGGVTLLEEHIANA